MAKGRGRKSNIELLPKECSHVVAWAAGELQNSDRTQLDIYQEFVSKLEYVKREHRGEIEFDLPSFSAFNRHSIKLDAITRDINETREMAAAIAGTFDAAESDDLTLIAAEAIKSLVFQFATTKKEMIDPKAVQSLANGLHKATQAQGVSTARRLKVEADFKAKAEKVIDTLAGEPGVSKEAIARARQDFLGVRPKKKTEEPDG